MIDKTGGDRALTLLFALPINADGWTWGDDMGHSRSISGIEEYANTVNMHSGANGKMSLYPLAAIWNTNTGLAIGMDMGYPAQYRLVYHAATKQFMIAYDLGLSPETRLHPNRADFRFVLFQFDPQWGFRAALQRYYEIFPEGFKRRVKHEGIWMPFTDIAKVPGFEDFGFGFQEGGVNVSFDDQHGIASFVYVEPMSHWLAMPAQAPRIYEGVLDVLNQDLAGTRGEEAKNMSAATFNSGIYGKDGKYSLSIQKAPWCDGAMFLLSPQPGIVASSKYPATKASMMQKAISNAFAKNRPANASTELGSGLDGVYLDSLEMGAEELNYRKDHFQVAAAPLVFDSQGTPCQLMFFSVLEFAKTTSSQMHTTGKWMFANAALWKYSLPAPLLDVMGTEVNWLSQGAYQPDSETVMNFRRSLCYQKPYCLLMNTDYSLFTTNLVERYFQHCLFYGIWPSFFDADAASKDPYWASSNRWYDRDRPLFKKYIPLFKKITDAGWNPITLANSDNSKILVERFGNDIQKPLFFTVFNNTETAQSGNVRFDFQKLGIRNQIKATRLITGAKVVLQKDQFNLQLAPHQAEVISLE